MEIENIKAEDLTDGHILHIGDRNYRYVKTQCDEEDLNILIISFSLGQTHEGVFGELVVPKDFVFGMVSTFKDNEKLTWREKARGPMPPPWARIKG